MNYSQRDAQTIWHPYTQHFKNPEFPAIVRAEKNHLYLESGKKLLDAISSWWVNLHGHSHPYINSQVCLAMTEMQQVMFAGFTHPYAVRLAEKILSLLGNNFARVFFSDNGSTSVEVALKMCFQFWSNRGEDRQKIIAFKSSYHGDTFGSMSVAERSLFSKSFWPFLFDVELISADSVDQLTTLLEKYPQQIAALIYEPMVQGAGGMLMPDPIKVEQVLLLARDHNILLIADEVMTGFGRTGKLFASDHMNVKPDVICLSKGLTGGILPLGLTVTTHEIFEAFQSSDKTKTLFHGHSFTGNVLSCSAALASIDLLEKDECQKKIQCLLKEHQSFADLLRNQTGPLKSIRTCGTILAMDFETTSKPGYLNSLGSEMSSFFAEKGILLRPLGNTLYVLPPYSFESSELDQTYSAILEFIKGRL